MRFLRVSTARNVPVFMALASDHVTGATGLSLTITAQKDGGAFGSISPSVTERGNGWYTLSLTTSHTDTIGDLALHITAALADPGDFAMQVVAFDFTSSTLGLGALGITLSAPFAADGSLTIQQGDDYTSVDGTPMDVSFTNLTYSLVGSTVTLVLHHRNSGVVTTVSGSALSATSMRFEPTATVTNALSVGEYDYYTQAVLASGKTHKPLRGRAQVLADYTP